MLAQIIIVMKVNGLMKKLMGMDFTRQKQFNILEHGDKINSMGYFFSKFIKLFSKE